ncbi:GNAT family N-acetyltransferase [Terrarubrum flagellatum]|uniref:GNAT family N-acetyltransferase n=1 Tax=Terrirubrum flagellatum TaxID=2895980 RepID=UPI0031452B8A
MICPAVATGWRHLTSGDQPELMAHFLRLKEAGLRSRFGRGVSETFLDAYCSAGFGESSRMIGYFDNGQLRAVGELRSGELAVSVESGWRRMGVATSLLKILLRVACEIGAQSLKAYCSAENVAAKRLMLRAGFKLMTMSAEVCGLLDVAARRGAFAPAA